jgi:hypothetical protein
MDFLNEETEYLDYLSQQELEAVVDVAFVKDERTGTTSKRFQTFFKTPTFLRPCSSIRFIFLIVYL